jgi:hypothetical protein
MTVTLIRLLFTLLLLVVVWRNAHWSVALALTLLFAGRELEALVLWYRERALAKFFATMAKLRAEAGERDKDAQMDTILRGFMPNDKTKAN